MKRAGSKKEQESKKQAAHTDDDEGVNRKTDITRNDGNPLPNFSDDNVQGLNPGADSGKARVTSKKKDAKMNDKG
jgi:hypothetical protein